MKKLIPILTVVFAAIVLFIGFRLDKVVAATSCTIAGYDSRGTIYNTYITCAGGGGSAINATAPITADTSTPGVTNVGFDYSHQGTFTGAQSFTNSLNVGVSGGDCTPQVTAKGLNLSKSGSYTDFYLYADSLTGFFHLSACQSHFTAKDIVTIDPGSPSFALDPSYPLQLKGQPDGCLQIVSEIAGSTGAGCGGTITAGANIVVTGGPTVATTTEPLFTTVDLPQPAFSPGTLVGLVDAGGGKSKLVQSNVSPCPTASCVVAVTGNAPITTVGTSMVAINVATPSPTCTGGISCSGTIFGLTITGTPQSTPSPTAGSGISITGSYPYIIAATVTPAPTSSPTTVGNIAYSLTYPYTVTVSTPKPSATGCGTVTGAFPYTIDTTNCATAAGAAITHISAGSNITVSPSSGPTPTVAVVSNPTFAGAVTGNTFTATSGANTQFVTSANHAAATSSFGTSFLTLEDNTSGINAVSFTARDGLNFQQLSSFTAGGAQRLFLGNGLGYAASTFGAISANWSYFREDATTACTGIGSGSFVTFPDQLCVTATGVTVTAFKDTALSASQAVCTDSSKNLQGCGIPIPTAGTKTCALSGTAACNVTAVVSSGSFCTTSYDHSTSVTLTALLPTMVSVSTTTLTLYGQTSSNQTGNLVFDYTCS